MMLASACMVLAGVLGLRLDAIREGNEQRETQWNLLLVNSEHPLPENYATSVDLLRLSNGEQVDERIYPALQQMFDEARGDGIDLFVRSGFRPRSAQETLFDQKVQEFLNQGYSEEDAVKEASGWVARPGCSEHETGLAVDINANNYHNTQETFAWLMANSWRYGFVQRYPTDKAAITGTYNEEWHYRYVGLEAAKTMHERRQCLEEYLGVR